MLEEHPAVKRRVDAVRVVHARYTEVELELSKKVEALMLEYDVKLAPFLARRAEIVSGRSEPTDAEARPLADYLAVCDVPPGEAEPGIPAFWLTAITEHEALADSVTEGDAAVLEYLQDVQCRKFNPGERTWAPLAKGPKPDLAELEQLNGFELIFEFAPNPHFEGTVLRKVVWTDEGYPAATQGSQIKWSPGMDITHKTVMKHSKTQNRKVKASEWQASFFHFFESRDFDLEESEQAQFDPALAAIKGGPTVVDKEVERHMQDLRMTLTFRDDLVPHAAEWVAMVMEDEDGDDL